MVCRKLRQRKYVFGRVEMYECNGSKSNVIRMSCTLNLVCDEHMYVFFFLHIHSSMYTNSKEIKKTHDPQENVQSELGMKNKKKKKKKVYYFHLNIAILSFRILFMCWFSCELGINNSVMFYSSFGYFPLNFTYKIQQTDRFFCDFKLHNDDLKQIPGDMRWKIHATRCHGVRALKWNKEEKHE